MAKHFEYVLAVWLRVEADATAAELVAGLQEHLETDYQVNKLEWIEDSGPTADGEHTVSLRLQFSFSQAEMNDGEPTQDAIDILDTSLKAHLEKKFYVLHLDILDDAPTSYLLDEWEDSEE